MSIELSIVIPCYNSKKSLHELNSRLLKNLKKLDVTFEIIYINDCSTDNTLEVLKELLKEDEQIIVIDLMYNVGQFRALICGLKESVGRYVVTMDDDLQHPPEEIEKLYKHLKNNKNLDVVLGKPKKKKHSFFRIIGSLITKKIDEVVFNKPKSITLSSFRCMNRRLVETLVSNNTISPNIGPLILKSTNRIDNVEINHNPRKYGKSTYHLSTLIRLCFDRIFNYSSLPLKYMSIIGIIISLISFILTLYFLIRHFMGFIALPGWTSIILMLNFYSGILLLSLGIIGEYIIRILQEVGGSPRYTIRDIYKSNS